MNEPIWCEKNTKPYSIAMCRVPNMTPTSPIVSGIVDNHKRPMKAEKIITLADPGEKEVDVFMPIADALYLQPGAEVRLFLNTDPTRPLKGRLIQTSYEPSENNGSLSYSLKAEIEDDGDFSRLGWQGTAKVYSNQEVTLFYYLFRKPISSTRQLFGF